VALPTVSNILDVADHPGPNLIVAGSTTVVTGIRDGVEIKVVMNNETGEIITGYPPKLPMNP
jgi:hypothetical protein